MTLPSILIEKPTKIHNISYFILGYSLTPLITPYLVNLPVETKILLITILGGYLGSLVFYIKPIERLISLYYRLSGNNEFLPPEPFSEFKSPIYRSDLVYSRFFYEERGYLNGAVFLAIGLFLSKSMLAQFNLIDIYPILSILGIILLGVGVWEVIQLISKKMDSVVFYYGYFNMSKKIPELAAALEMKDWEQAKKIQDEEWELVDPDLYYRFFAKPVPKKSFCPKCAEILEGEPGDYCTTCGTVLIDKCPNCGRSLSIIGASIFFCNKCGSKLYNRP